MSHAPIAQSSQYHVILRSWPFNFLSSNVIASQWPQCPVLSMLSHLYFLSSKCYLLSMYCPSDSLSSPRSDICSLCLVLPIYCPTIVLYWCFVLLICCSIKMSFFPNVQSSYFPEISLYWYFCPLCVPLMKHPINIMSSKYTLKVIFGQCSVGLLPMFCPLRFVSSPFPFKVLSSWYVVFMICCLLGVLSSQCPDVFFLCLNVPGMSSMSWSMNVLWHLHPIPAEWVSMQTGWSFGLHALESSVNNSPRNKAKQSQTKAVTEGKPRAIYAMVGETTVKLATKHLKPSKLLAKRTISLNTKWLSVW